MAGIITRATDLAMFRAGVLSLGNLTLRLFMNDIAPSKLDDASQYVEAAGSGYAPKALAAASWSFAEGPPPLATFAQQSFGFTGALGSVYGYFILDGAGELRGAERFVDGPYPVLRAGDIIRVSPSIAAVTG